mmetsp:Transcript_441/g.877  ORF Transcript_441/g.877 Transcript_441/m.877 type:complete len:121 (-) Transcript_441:926-1288(-)
MRVQDPSIGGAAVECQAAVCGWLGCGVRPRRAAAACTSRGLRALRLTTMRMKPNLGDGGRVAVHAAALCPASLPPTLPPPKSTPSLAPCPPARPSLVHNAEACTAVLGGTACTQISIGCV